MRCYVFLTGLKWKFEVAMAKVNILITSNKWEWIPLRKLTMVYYKENMNKKKHDYFTFTIKPWLIFVREARVTNRAFVLLLG